MSCLKQGLLKVLETFLSPSKFLSFDHETYNNYLALLLSYQFIHALPPLLFVAPIAVLLSRLQYAVEDNPTWHSALGKHIGYGFMFLLSLHFSFLLGIILQEMVYCTTETLFDKLDFCQESHVYWRVPAHPAMSQGHGGCAVGHDEVGLLVSSSLLACYLTVCVRRLLMKEALPPFAAPSTARLQELARALGVGLVAVTRGAVVAVGTAVCVAAIKGKDKGRQIVQTARDGLLRLRGAAAAAQPLGDGGGDAPLPDDLLG